MLLVPVFYGMGKPVTADVRHPAIKAGLLKYGEQYADPFCRERPSLRRYIHV